MVRDEDRIKLSVAKRRFDLSIVEQEMRERLSRWSPQRGEHLRGYPRLYIDHVLQADRVCDIDFLRPASNEGLRFVPPIVGRTYRRLEWIQNL